MSHIRSTNSKPEEIVRKYLFSQGLRYRKNVKKLPGCPDIVLPKYHTVIFVNGCFWHRHDCSRFVWPSSNQDYWRPKILRNVERDKKNTEELKALLPLWLCPSGWVQTMAWCPGKCSAQNFSPNACARSTVKPLSEPSRGSKEMI